MIIEFIYFSLFNLTEALDEILRELGLRLELALSNLHLNTGNVYDAYQEAFSIARHFPFFSAHGANHLLSRLSHGAGAQGA